MKFNLTRADFDRERDILQEAKHENVVDLLYSYTYEGEYSLLFKLEPMDLNDFFQQEQRYKDFESNTTFYTAIHGLASALEYFHNHRLRDDEQNLTITGYHRDIRPHNILVRHNTFVLADFGLAKIDDGNKSKSSSTSSYHGGGGDYVAPECLMKGKRIGQAADIWSFGALIVDIASYMEQGPEGKRTAQDVRSRTGKDPNSRTTQFFSIGQ